MKDLDLKGWVLVGAITHSVNGLVKIAQGDHQWAGIFLAFAAVFFAGYRWLAGRGSSFHDR